MAVAKQEMYLSGKIKDNRYGSNIWGLGPLVEIFVNYCAWFLGTSEVESPLGKFCGRTLALVGVWSGIPCS